MINILKRVIPICLLVFIYCVGKSQPSSVIISLLTCSPGEELYSIYGHNALRIIDPEAGTDLVYNYGTFDFDTPNFALKFMRGQLPYQLSVARYGDFMAEYQYFERSVTEQVLQLNANEKRSIIAYMNRNMLPENREYKYDFFMDNCATRLRDVIEDNVENVKWDPSKKSEKTFRQIIKEYQQKMPWTNFGIDLIIGAPADKKTTLSQEMFIPDYLAEAVTHAKIGPDGSRDLQYSKADLIRFDHRSASTPFIFTPIFIFLLLLVGEIYLFYTKAKETKFIKIYDTIWAILIGLASVVMLFMWFGTDHIPTRQNWNVLWANLLITVWYYKLRFSSVSKWIFYFLFLCLILSIANAFFFILPQYFHFTTSVISMILLLKLLRWTKANNQSTK